MNPATDSNWIYNNTGIIWKLDVDGDNLDDYWVGLVNDAGPLAAVTPPGDAATILCHGDPYFGSSGFILVTFNRTCIGSPAGFQVRAYHRYGWSTTTSEDYAPSDGRYCCTVFAPATSTPPPSSDPGIGTASAHSGYWMVTDNGQVFNFGDAQDYGSELATTVKRVDVEPTPTGKGYWILAESGAVHNKGDAKWLGSALNVLSSGEKAASLSSTPSGNGYWIWPGPSPQLRGRPALRRHDRRAAEWPSARRCRHALRQRLLDGRFRRRDLQFRRRQVRRVDGRKGSQQAGHVDGTRPRRLRLLAGRIGRRHLRLRCPNSTGVWAERR